jgi:NADP-dependent 3-hydroxy acid dehydrogenase YdfG
MSEPHRVAAVTGEPHRVAAVTGEPHKIAAVTGGSAGIGKAVCEDLLAQGYEVV